MNARRWWVGLGWGMAGTLAMSGVMIAGMLSRLSPMPKPIPVALVARAAGSSHGGTSAALRPSGFVTDMSSSPARPITLTALGPGT